MKILKRISPVFIVIALCFFAILPLFHQGFFPMHDDEQVGRLYELDQALGAGHVPPRISPNLGFGYGYPFFNFYPSFAYYVGEAFHVLGFSYIISTKLMLASGFVFAALFIYLLAKELFGRQGGVVSSAAYTYASYHAVDVYVRGAFAEFFAFVFLPLIFWAILKLRDSNNFSYAIVGSLGVGGLILSHNLIALMAAPFFAVWLLYILYISKNKARFVWSSILLFVLGFGLTAYFWLPSYVERSYTLVNILTSELANYSIHFVCVHQLWNSPWGYGGSIPSCFDGLSFEIGKAHIVLSFIAFLLAFYFLIKRKQKKQSLTVLIFVGFLGLSSFFMVKYSKPLWDSFSLFWYVQFPWRFLLFTSFFSAVLCGSVIAFIKDKRAKLIVSSLFVLLLIGLNFSRFTPERFISVTDADYINKETLRWHTSSLAYEYVPKGIAVKKSKFDTTLIAIEKSDIATSASSVVSGSMEVKTLVDLPQHKKFDIDVLSLAVLQINTYSFPGWTVFVDGKKTLYSDANKLKLIHIGLDQGNHLVEARFLDTPIRKTGNVTSIISIIVLIILVAIVIIYEHKKAKS